MYCKDCKFWDVIVSTSGHCRRHSPHPEIRRPKENEKPQSNPETTWPCTGPEDWCGEFKPASANSRRTA